MSLPDLLLPDDLSKKDFTEANCEDIVNKLDPREISRYSAIFGLEADQAKESNNFKKYTVLFLLSVIAFPVINFNQEPFDFNYYAKIDVYTQERGEPDARKFINKYLNILKDWAPEINDVELRARVTDFIWLENHDQKMAKLAVDSYLKSAENFEAPVLRWNLCYTRIKRAKGLAWEINYHFDDIVAYIETLLEKYKDKDEDPASLFHTKLMELLQDY